MILQTAIKHFNEDIQRAKNLRTHGEELPPGELRRDIYRASWMIAVGAFDAYFCDAYGDLLARTFRAKKSQPDVILPNRMKNITVPIPIVLENDLSGGWAWRMIARDLIEKDNVLAISKIKTLFNVFFRKNHKLFSVDGQPLKTWIEKQQNRQRLFGFQRTSYRQAGSPAAKKDLRESALKKLESRLGQILQRRHDCIHNCDRPKTAVTVKHMSARYVQGVIGDLEFVVNQCHIEMKSEFPIFLRELGFNGATRNSVGA